MTKFVTDFLGIIAKALKDLSEALQERRNKLEYFEKAIQKQYPNNKKMRSVLFILLQNRLFGEDRIGIKEICKNAKIGESKVRDLLKQLEDENILEIMKEGRKHIYILDLEYFEDLSEEY